MLLTDYPPYRSSADSRAALAARRRSSDGLLGGSALSQVRSHTQKYFAAADKGKEMKFYAQPASTPSALVLASGSTARLVRFNAAIGDKKESQKK